MRLRGKCPLVNMLHIFGTPIRKYTTGGLLVGGIIYVSTFLAWTHVYFVSFDRINTVVCQCDFYFKLLSWLEYHTSSILLCSHGAYCLNRVCTQKTFNLSRLALSIIIFATLFRVSILNLLFRYDWERGGGVGRWKKEGAELLIYLNSLTFVWQQLEAWNFAQGIFNTIGFEWCKYISCDDHGLKRRDNHGLKTGLHFFSFQKVNKQNKHLHVWW